MSEAVQQVPVIRLSVSKEIGQGHQIILETYVASDADPNPLLDKLSSSIARQSAREELPHLERLLAKRMKEHERALQDIERLDQQYNQRREDTANNGRRQPTGMSSKERIDRENAVTTIERWRQEALELEEQIAHRKNLLNGGA